MRGGSDEMFLVCLMSHGRLFVILHHLPTYRMLTQYIRYIWLTFIVLETTFSTELDGISWRDGSSDEAVTVMTSAISVISIRGNIRADIF